MGIGGGAVGLTCAVLASLAYGSGSVAQAAGLGAARQPAGPAPAADSGAPGAVEATGAGPGTVGPAVPGVSAAAGAGAGTGALSGVRRMARSPLYLIGLTLDGLGFAASLVALRQLPVFVVQSILATSLAVTVVLARVFLRASLRRVDVAAVAVAALACALTASAGSEGPAATPTGAVVAGGVIAAAAVLVAGLLFARRRSPSWLLATVSGVGFSVQVLAARGLSLDGVSRHHRLAALGVLVSQPLVWTLIVAGATGIVLYGLALERGGVAAATAILWVVEIVVPTVCGVLLLGDTVRPGWTIPLVLALAAATGAAVVLARSPAQL